MGENLNAGFVGPELWGQVPVEIWSKILSQIHSPLQPRATAERRRVCKIWRDVIDEHLDFQVVLDDRKLNTSHISHLRVTRCVVACLDNKVLVRGTPIFQNATVLKELCLWGGITKNNWGTLVSQLPSVEIVSVTDYPLYSVQIHKPLPGLEKDFTRFYNGLKKLTVTSTSFANLQEVFSLTLPNLVNFSLSLPNLKYQQHEYRSMAKFTLDMFTFLGRSSHLKHLHVRYGLFHGNNGDGNKMPWMEDYDGDQASEQKLEHQLETLRLAVKSQVIANWITTIKAQRELKDMRILVGEADRLDIRMTDEARCRVFEHLRETLVLNQSTLSIVELQNVCLSAPLNAEIFGKMKNLSRLVLRHFKVDTRPHIFNLGELPGTLQAISLERIACATSDLMIMADKLDEVKSVQLLDLRDSKEGTENVPELGINQYVIDSLCRKKKIRKLHMRWLNLSKLVCGGVGGEEYCLANGTLQLKLKNQRWGPSIDHQFERHQSDLSL